MQLSVVSNLYARKLHSLFSITLYGIDAICTQINITIRATIILPNIISESLFFVLTPSFI